MIILVLASLLVGAASFFFVFRPQSEKIEQTRLLADETEAKARSLKIELQRLRELQKNAPKLREEAAKLDAAMPNDPQLAQFILQVQEAATASGIDWLSVNPTPPAAASPPQPGVLEVNITMAVEGGYFQVQDFLVRLETLSRAVRIQNLNLTATDEQVGGGSPKLSSALTVKMFVSSAAQAPPPAAAPAA